MIPAQPGLERAGAARAYPDQEWQSLLKSAIRSPHELLTLLDLQELLPQVDSATEFAMRVPQPFWQRMQPGNPQDPLLRQILPLVQERAEVAGYAADPLQEAAATATAGLIHKYSGRALVIATGACAVNCRYCFRRHFPYQEHGAKAFQPMLEHVRADSSISEVILSGGDPLVLTDSALGQLLDALAAIPHVTRIRIHSRLPIVLPQRLTLPLLKLFQRLPIPLVMVVHANHSNELDAATARAIACLTNIGVTVLNQTVLLAGINDNKDALIQLSEALFAQGILPYYLHLPDAVAGTAHFDVPLARAQHLFRDISSVLSGYLVPRLVREVPGASGKEIVNI